MHLAIVGTLLPSARAVSSGVAAARDVPFAGHLRPHLSRTYSKSRDVATHSPGRGCLLLLAAKASRTM